MKKSKTALVIITACIASIIALFAITGEITVSADSTEFVGEDDIFHARGDVNRDRIVNQEDAEYMLMGLYFPEKYPAYGANVDFNNDGAVNDRDVSYLMMHIACPDKYPIEEQTQYNEDNK